MPSLLEGLPPQLIKKCKKVTQPSFVAPMLATLTDDYFSSHQWIYEHKFDGERCIVIKKNGTVALLSRNRKKINNEYPELVRALEAQEADNFIIDGEIIARDKTGISNFELLQSRINLKALEDIKAKVTITPITFCIFDIMYADEHDIRALPLLVRKKILKKLLTFNKILTYTTHYSGNGITLFKQACHKHWEGLIVKKSDSTYEGKRSRAWLKFKCSVGQELVIGGYTAPKGSRTDFGALLVGYYKKGKLQYAGKVGSGYSHETLRILGKKLKNLTIKKCPFANYNGTEKEIFWVKPTLVANFKFAQWTAAGRLRVPRYQGLRADKRAKDVVKET